MCFLLNVRERSPNENDSFFLVKLRHHVLRFFKNFNLIDLSVYGLLGIDKIGAYNSLGAKCRPHHYLFRVSSCGHDGVGFWVMLISVRYWTSFVPPAFGKINQNLSLLLIFSQPVLVYEGLHAFWTFFLFIFFRFNFLMALFIVDWITSNCCAK